MLTVLQNAIIDTIGTNETGMTTGTTPAND